MWPSESPACERNESGPVATTTIPTLEFVGDSNQLQGDVGVDDFHPRTSSLGEWMHRSMEALILGHQSRAPLLALDVDTGQEQAYDDFWACRRRSTASTFGRRRSSLMDPSRRLSIRNRGGTLARYHSRRRAVPLVDTIDRTSSSRGSNGPMYRRRSNGASTGTQGRMLAQAPMVGPSSLDGPCLVLKLIAREATGLPTVSFDAPISAGLVGMGGTSLFRSFDRRGGCIATDVSFLYAAIDEGDLSEVKTIVSRMLVKLGGDWTTQSDNMPALAPLEAQVHPRRYAGGGSLGMERDIFIHSGGVVALLQIFGEQSLVGREMAEARDARVLSTDVQVARLLQCWNNTLVLLRDLVVALPRLVHDEPGLRGFIPVLFTLLWHDSCFDASVALLEEMLSCLSQAPCRPLSYVEIVESHCRGGQLFFLGNVPDLYGLWRGFDCRQLVHFCRVLALLVFEAEDRCLLENSAVVMSLELLSLRRKRAARAPSDSVVDLNQAVVLGDNVLLARLVMVIGLMNYAPSLHKSVPYRMITHLPFLSETLALLGLDDIVDWDELDRFDAIGRQLRDCFQDRRVALCDLGGVATMLQSLSIVLFTPGFEESQAHPMAHILAAAQDSGVAFGTSHGGASMGSRYSVQAHRESVQHLAGHPGYSGWREEENARNKPNDRLEPRWLSDDDRKRLLQSTLSKAHADVLNRLQMNALRVSPFQAEVFFVLSTLLGGKRKADAQRILVGLESFRVLEDMFDRLPWTRYLDPVVAQERNDDERRLEGVHSPDCECTPVSAICIQFLRVVHNICDRDCVNYSVRRLMLSADERRCTAEDVRPDAIMKGPRRGLLSKLVHVMTFETDESPYRFWLCSCVESFLRGAGPSDQAFVTRIGLLDFLVREIASERLHCVGNLQSLFDLLAELGRGNPSIHGLLFSKLDDLQFVQFMTVAISNVVDSNVFLRSLLLGLERAPGTPSRKDHVSALEALSRNGSQLESCYLSHTWLDVYPRSLHGGHSGVVKQHESTDALLWTSEWFPAPAWHDWFYHGLHHPRDGCSGGHNKGVTINQSFGDHNHYQKYIQRLQWFFARNWPVILRDIVDHVELRCVNHENICCLNTAVLMAVFANRDGRLPALLNELSVTVQDKAVAIFSDTQSVGVQMIKPETACTPSKRQIGKLRELLWFWTAYYAFRGRDRLSLEFSSHVRFEEWSNVVKFLMSDNYSPVRAPMLPLRGRRVPRSPYQRAADGLNR